MSTPVRPLQKVLIANRGEIALRILLGARELGMEVVGVYSSADVHLPHLSQCDETYEIGPPPSAESYLVMEKLIDVAKKSGCDCVHPGYGFLAESSDFARKVEAAGLVWVGPNPRAIDMMGDKIESKRLMAEAGVPTIPGFTAKIGDDEFNRSEANRVGYPLLVKPTAGGGGKGMQVVYDEKELLGTLEASEEMAIKAFGRGGLLVERYLQEPRHIEVQVLGDKHGNVIHCLERECSIQRRQQKLIEECPSPFVGPELREKICAAGVEAGRACGYDSAGTVECLVDGKTGEFFFLEMNTRLQVEHPVTEAVTGIDLCQSMFRVAAGEELWIKQDDVKINGHAIEARIIAEDPFTNFMPSFGMLTAFDQPTGPFIRVDAGFQRGTEVSQYYDSLIAKLITWGRDRPRAIRRMLNALDRFQILGPQTCIPFHKRMFQHESFVSGKFDVHTCERLMKEGLMNKTEKELDIAAALALAVDVMDLKPRRASAAAVSAASGGSDGADPSSRPAERTLWKYAARPSTLRDLK